MYTATYFFCFLFIYLSKFGCPLWSSFQVTESNFPCFGSRMSGIGRGRRIVFQMDLLFLKDKNKELKTIRKAEQKTNLLCSLKRKRK